jgi:hypothetical protein
MYAGKGSERQRQELRDAVDRNLNLFIKAPERESMVYVQGRGELLLDDMILAQGFYASKASAKMANEPRRPAWIGAI